MSVIAKDIQIHWCILQPLLCLYETKNSKLTQVATNRFFTFQKGFSSLSPPRRGVMSIENGVFTRLHSVGVLCL